MDAGHDGLGQAAFFDSVGPQGLNRRFSEFRGDDYSYLRSTLRLPSATAQRPIRIVDLFCGAGGLSLGAEEALASLNLRAETVFAADFDAPAVECFRANFPSAQVRLIDLTSVFDPTGGEALTAEEMRLAERVGPVDLLVGGPPCQGHSDLNNFSRRADPKNHLYQIMSRAARVLRPDHVLIENVPGASHDRSGVVARSVTELRTLGYHVDVGIADALMLGVPQRRKRLVVLASQSRQINIESVVQKYGVPVRTVAWAIQDIQDELANSLASIPAKSSVANRARIDYLFDHDIWDLPNQERPPCHRDKSHTYNSVYGRLRWDLPAQTITSGFYSVCMGRFVHPAKRRSLTAHEAARLQFFPDYFKFEPAASRTAMARVIGNAVPPKLAYPFVRELFLDDQEQQE